MAQRLPELLHFAALGLFLPWLRFFLLVLVVQELWIQACPNLRAVPGYVVSLPCMEKLLSENTVMVAGASEEPV